MFVWFKRILSTAGKAVRKFTCRHDYDMVFPDESSLAYYMQCTKCGDKQRDMQSALRNM